MRYLTQQIQNDLKEKMVFLTGPRQVGKTTLALELLGTKDAEHPAYMNWDHPALRSKIRTLDIPKNQKLLVFDEIHKYKKWRNLIKGAYDIYKSKHQFLITGSARLDYYKRGGDSLHGRYHMLRLHPVSLAEAQKHFKGVSLKQLFDFGGFPEPLFKGSSLFSRRWRKQRIDKILSEDVRSLERVEEISLLEELIDALPIRVGTPLSYKSLSEDLQVSPKSVKRWVDIFERLYLCFRIAPYGSPKIRAVKKEQKLYLWDWTEIEEPGFRFENMVACHLLKYCHFLEDTEGYKMELRYLRDTDSREVDFVIVQNHKPLFAIECKLSATALSSHIHYFKNRTPIPRFYQVCYVGNVDQGDEEINGRLISFDKLSALLGLL